MPPPYLRTMLRLAVLIVVIEMAALLVPVSFGLWRLDSGGQFDVEVPFSDASRMQDELVLANGSGACKRVDRVYFRCVFTSTNAAPIDDLAILLPPVAAKRLQPGFRNFTRQAGPAEALGLLPLASAYAVQLLVGVILLRWIGRGPTVPLPRPRRALLVLLPVAATLGVGAVLYLAGHVSERVAIPSSASTTEAVAWIVLLCGLAPFVEELVFRALLFGAVEKEKGATAAYVISTGAFLLAHLPPDLSSAAQLAVAGLALGHVWHRTRSLPLCVAAHGVLNAAGLALNSMSS